MPPDCSSALLGKNWSARGGEGEGLWMVEVSMKFRKISQYSERGSFSLLKVPYSTVTLKNLHLTTLFEIGVYKQ